ncbi:methylglutaconyl-CoA hydratase [Ferrimonas sediminum]|uniref:Methylglutaconyl-CoA hydratase n=1 Tax=Ferrimonas sediminum TaxID=718193 RepID=A0A1G8LHI1_9GAMM|nr:enoyl-CoA hydratase-related protein [Ferrimonas sediminum]SDI55164.1 methylglutaconyl-CoA hydratase [Ferrimonas sediminum]
MTFQFITLTQSDGVARLTLNRPDKHNAFGDTMIGEINQALAELTRQPPTLLVLAANGKHFSAGADLAWMKSQAAMDQASNLSDARELARLMHTLDRFPAPTLALVDGAAFGGALGLIACCDIALASPRARFCLSEVKLGLIPAVISPFVARAIGQRQSRRYMLSAETFDANTARQIGLVHEVCEELTSSSEHLIATLTGNGPKAMQACKSLLHTIEQHPFDDALLSLTADAIAQIRVSPEGQEGLQAFFDKRPPLWQGES